MPQENTNGRRSDRRRGKVAGGSAKVAVGKVLGDAKLQSEGRADKVESSVQNAVGAISDTLRAKWARRWGGPMIHDRNDEGAQAVLDQIVMGTFDERGVSRLVLDSVAADVAGRAHCSVTVAR